MYRLHHLTCHRAPWNVILQLSPEVVRNALIWLHYKPNCTTCLLSSVTHWVAHESINHCLLQVSKLHLEKRSDSIAQSVQSIQSPNLRSRRLQWTLGMSWDKMQKATSVPLHTRAKSRDHGIMRAQYNLSKGRHKTPPVWSRILKCSGKSCVTVPKSNAIVIKFYSCGSSHMIE